MPIWHKGNDAVVKTLIVNILNPIFCVNSGCLTHVCDMYRSLVVRPHAGRTAFEFERVPIRESFETL